MKRNYYINCAIFVVASTLFLLAGAPIQAVKAETTCLYLEKYEVSFSEDSKKEIINTKNSVTKSREIDQNDIHDWEYNYYNFDHVGSTSIITDETGTLFSQGFNKIRYFPYGEQIIKVNNSDLPNDILYSGMEYDAEVNLVFFGTRNYNSTTGRFIQPDSHPDTFNRYMFVVNNPINSVDPSGNDCGPVSGGNPSFPGMNGLCGSEYIEALEGISHEKDYSGVEMTVEIGVPIAASIVGADILFDGYEVLTGKSWLTGEKLAWWQRGLSGIGVLIPVVTGSLLSRSAMRLAPHADEGAELSRAINSAEEFSNFRQAAIPKIHIPADELGKLTPIRSKIHARSGSAGNVVKAYTSGSGHEYAIKVWGDVFIGAERLREIENTKFLSDLGYGPKFHGAMTDSNGKIIGMVVDRVTGDFPSVNPSAITDKTIRNLETMMQDINGRGLRVEDFQILIDEKTGIPWIIDVEFMGSASGNAMYKSWTWLWEIGSNGKFEAVNELERIRKSAPLQANDAGW